jgi:F-type H+-transporting ATPase subunit epsilon
MRFELATPTRMLISADVEEVVAPGTEGYFGVWPGHAPFLTTLGSGEVCYKMGRDEQCLAVSGGFAEVTGERVIILAETAELPEEIDVERAQRAKQRAELRLSGKSPLGTPEEIDYTRAMAALARAVARLMTAGRLSQH